jgi:hypothetical protein
MSRKIYQKTVSCVFCGRTTHAISAYTEGELRQLGFAYKICMECQKDPRKIAELEKSKDEYYRKMDKRE